MWPTRRRINDGDGRRRLPLDLASVAADPSGEQVSVERRAEFPERGGAVTTHGDREAVCWGDRKLSAEPAPSPGGPDHPANRAPHIGFEHPGAVHPGAPALMGVDRSVESFGIDR